MSRVLRRSVAAFLFSSMGVACILPGSSSIETVGARDAGTPDTDGPVTVGPSGGCTSDSECSGTPCAQWHCVDHQCKATNYPDGTTPTVTTPIAAVCQRAVCDGDGGLRNAPDPNAVSTEPAPACLRNACSDNGLATFAPDPSHAPPATPGTCQKPVCDADGGMSSVADPTNVPADQAGDCQKNSCTADGTPTKVPDDVDPPPPTTCATYTCSSGTVVSTPANPTATCAPLGFVCGNDGMCKTCPTPDAACDEPGVGSRSPSAPYDFQGIGNCDDGGRYLCGAAASGQADYYTYYDDKTGLLCSFDPYFEIEPTAPVTLCAYFDCGSVSCPGGSTASTSANGQPGCCLNASPGAFTGMAVNFCAGGRVTLKVTSASGCAGYQLHFHD